jgi:hypothetical protein
MGDVDVHSGVAGSVRMVDSDGVVVEEGMEILGVLEAVDTHKDVHADSMDSVLECRLDWAASFRVDIQRVDSWACSEDENVGMDMEELRRVRRTIGLLQVVHE